MAINRAAPTVQSLMKIDIFHKKNNIVRLSIRSIIFKSQFIEASEASEAFDIKHCNWKKYPSKLFINRVVAIATHIHAMCLYTYIYTWEKYKKLIRKNAQREALHFTHNENCKPYHFYLCFDEKRVWKREHGSLMSVCSARCLDGLYYVSEAE